MFSGRRVGGAYIIWLQRLRPLQRVSSTKIQRHKQLIKVRWGRQESCLPCWDVQCLPGHCYPTTKSAGWDAQTKEWEQTEIRDGYEEDSRNSLFSLPRSPVGRRFSLDQQIVRPELPPIKENECFKGSELIRKVALLRELLSRQLSEGEPMKRLNSSTQENVGFYRLGGVGNRFGDGEQRRNVWC